MQKVRPISRAPSMPSDLITDTTERRRLGPSGQDSPFSRHVQAGIGPVQGPIPAATGAHHTGPESRYEILMDMISNVLEHKECKRVYRNILSISRIFRYASPAKPNSPYRQFGTNLPGKYSAISLLMTLTKRRGLKLPAVQMPKANVCCLKIED